MSLFSSKKEKQAPNRLLISRTDKIGDMVLSIPSFFMLRQMYPQAKIAVIASIYNAPLVKYADFIDEVIAIDAKHPQTGAQKVKNFAADEFIALYSDKTVIQLAALSKAKTIIGPISKPLSWFIYNRGVIQSRSKSVKNEAEYNLDLVRQSNPQLFDNNKSPISTKIKYSTDEDSKASNYLAENHIKGKFVLAHIFSGGSAKNFTMEEYAKIICMISSKLPSTPIILSGHREEYEIITKIKYLLPPKNIYIYQTDGDILSFTALIDKCAVFLGGSTGPTHIAGNLCKKTVAVFPAKKSQSKIRWGLFGNDENTTYIVPDNENNKENYNVKTFDNISNEILEKTAVAVAEKFMA